MRESVLKIILLFLACISPLAGEQGFGTLIFHDDFERSESQEQKDEPGNDWTTSSDKTAYGEKQVDLRDGYMYIYTHKKAWHATSVRQTFEFKNGTLGLKIKFDDPMDNLHLNFTDLSEESVHAGHLFNLSLSPSRVTITDLKTGVHNLKIKKAKKEKTLTQEQLSLLKTKSKNFKYDLALGKWHQIYATVAGDKVSCEIDGKLIGEFNSPGFAHATKTMIRLLVSQTVSVDEVKIWRKP